MAEVNVPGEDEPSSESDQRVAALELENAQLRAQVAQLNEKLRAVQTVPAAPAKVADPNERLIGENWATRTAAEAKEAGVTRPVLCSDGYYVP